MRVKVDRIRGAEGRGRVPLAITYEGRVFRTSVSVYRGYPGPHRPGAGRLRGCPRTGRADRGIRCPLIHPPQGACALDRGGEETRDASPAHRSGHRQTEVVRLRPDRRLRWAGAACGIRMRCHSPSGLQRPCRSRTVPEFRGHPRHPPGEHLHPAGPDPATTAAGPAGAVRRRYRRRPERLPLRQQRCHDHDDRKATVE
ncbi:unannotated protein [freshwater metagenome]|uniref:Unannotated protein n=1 Tax=freshwater metagenome TaxID=449393 RepID=A0A6J7K6P6_9ZZZZ